MHLAAFDGSRDAMCPTDIICEDGGTETVFCVVRFCNGLSFRIEASNSLDDVRRKPQCKEPSRICYEPFR